MRWLCVGVLGGVVGELSSDRTGARAAAEFRADEAHADCGGRCAKYERSHVNAAFVLQAAEFCTHVPLDFSSLFLNDDDSALDLSLCLSNCLADIGDRKVAVSEGEDLGRRYSVPVTGASRTKDFRFALSLSLSLRSLSFLFRWLLAVQSYRRNRIRM